MPKETKSDMRRVARRELESRGYIIRLSTARDGDNMIGRVQVSEAASEKTVARFVGVGKVDDLELVFGIDATEGIARDFLSQVMNLADLLRYFIPGLTFREE